MQLSLSDRTFYFPSKINFERKILNSVIGVLFPSPETAHDGRAQVCRVVGVLYNTCVGRHRRWEAGDGGFEYRF